MRAPTAAASCRSFSDGLCFVLHFCFVLFNKKKRSPLFGREHPGMNPLHVLDFLSASSIMTSGDAIEEWVLKKGASEGITLQATISRVINSRLA